MVKGGAGCCGTHVNERRARKKKKRQRDRDRQGERGRTKKKKKEEKKEREPRAVTTWSAPLFFWVFLFFVCSFVCVFWRIWSEKAYTRFFPSVVHVSSVRRLVLGLGQT